MLSNLWVKPKHLDDAPAEYRWLDATDIYREEEEIPPNERIIYMICLCWILDNDDGYIGYMRGRYDWEFIHASLADRAMALWLYYKDRDQFLEKEKK